MAVTTAPDTVSGVRVTVEDGVATLLIDRPNDGVNIIDEAFVEDFERAVAELGPDLRGVIVASGKEGQFIAGADLKQFLRSSGTAQEVEEVTRRFQRALNRLAHLPYPSVAAINGAALGGGLEVALACDYRVAAENNRNVLGLPEVQLGLLPAGGGCQRLPRLIGLSRALGLILEARRYNTRRASRYGVVDEVVHPAVLMEAAAGWLSRGKRDARPKWELLDRAAERWGPVRSVMYLQAGRTVARKTRGHYPAPALALDAVRAGQEQGFGAGLAAEAVHFGQLASGPVARNLIRIFFATESLKKDDKALSALARPISRVGVVGAGFMGAGIAQAAAAAGYQVRARDVEPAQVAKGLRTARKLTTDAARKGRFSRQEAQAIVSRLSGSTDYSGFRRADLVIEAVFEDVGIKRKVIADLEEIVPPETVIASNTSSLPIGSLAAEARRPERVLGMHFFSPVHKMPLLEVIRTDRSSEQAVATAVQAGLGMGKTVIVVNDGPGFYTTRALTFMSQEAIYLLMEGGAIEDIDRAMVGFGFPVGPLALADEVGLEVAAHVGDVMHGAFPERFAGENLIARMIEAGRLGRKSGSGFYDYRGRRKKPDSAVYALRQAPPQRFPRDLIQRRLSLALINEAARCLEEGILSSPRDGDVGAIMGFGYPPFLGGPFRYADSLGIASVVDQLRQMANAYGPRFEPAEVLQGMGREGASFYEG